MPAVELLGTTLDLPDAPFSRREREVLRWQKPIRCSEWAERYRRLHDDEANISGPWSNDNAPYLRGIMDLGFVPGVRELATPKAAQCGVSEAMRNVMGYIAHHDPGPAALALPDKEKGQQIVSKKVVPLFRRTPALKRLMTARAHDVKKQEISLANAFTLYLMWSGSASSMASHPIRYAIADETDKFQAWTGTQSNALPSMRMRLRTYGERSRLWKVSTPTLRIGTIWTEHEQASVRLYFVVPCPGCGGFQRLLFGQLQWEKPKGIDDPNALADHIERNNAVWYECRLCDHAIRDRDKRRMLRSGRWASCDEHGLPDGEIEDAEAVEAFPPGTRLSMHISALYPVWVPFASVAAEHLRAHDSLEARYDFVTETLGEPFEQQVAAAQSSTFAAKSEESDRPEGVVPAWAAKLLATIDTQDQGYWLVVRAWGPGRRSQRVFHSWVDTEAELDRWLFGTPWPVEGDRFPPMTVELALIDTGGGAAKGQRAGRTMDAYRYALERAPYVRSIKGDNQPRGQLIRRGQGILRESERQTQGTEVPLWLIDVQHFQDELAELIERRASIPGEGGDPLDVAAWELNQRNDPEYNAHLSAMRKVAVNERGQMVERWIPHPPGARHDYRDLEVYQVAAAYMAGVHVLPDHQTFMQMKEAELAEARQRANHPDHHRTGLTTPDGRPFVATER